MKPGFFHHGDCRIGVPPCRSARDWAYVGFPHEHTRDEIVNRIDSDKAITYFMATQGWTRDQVIAQVLTPLDNSALMETAHADPVSIMCYWRRLPL